MFYCAIIKVNNEFVFLADIYISVSLMPKNIKKFGATLRKILDKLAFFVNEEKGKIII